ncbi:hypothetical protein [Akkermansia muciniphila]|uniref:hypothetical protein n=1 Tax=Akkermansia muciniphila TaxID=239935 RepID=UPI001BFF039B|nr:hypothetical protein [Akkermansia muciniphila]
MIKREGAFIGLFQNEIAGGEADFKHARTDRAFKINRCLLDCDACGIGKKDGATQAFSDT